MIDRPDADNVGHRKPRLRDRVLKAGGWVLGGHLTSQSLRLVSSLIMTRLLAPDMFGVMAIAGVFSMVLTMISDMGLRLSAIQSPRGHTSEYLNTVWSLQILRGTAIWLGCMGIAVALYFTGRAGLLPAGSAYAAPILPFILAASSLSAVLHGLQSTRAIAATRNMDMRRTMTMEIVAQAFGLLVMASLGWLTRSIWALVAGGLSSAAMSVVLSHTWLPGQRNRLEWHRPTVTELVRNGRWVAMSSMTHVLSITADRMLLAGWTTAAYLGLYGLALQLSNLIENACVRLFQSVAMAALSEVARKDRARFRAAFYKLRLPFDALFVGGAGFLFAAGQSVIDLLYDTRYAEAGWMLQILSFKMIFTRYMLNNTAYLALGAPRDQAVINMTRLAAVLTLVPLLAIPYGLKGAVWAIALQMAPTWPMIWRLNRKYGLNNARFELLTLLFWPLGYALGLGFATVLGGLKPHLAWR
jgi:O-antigen/teichoic acid export membrane protein